MIKKVRWLIIGSLATVVVLAGGCGWSAMGVAKGILNNSLAYNVNYILKDRKQIKQLNH